MPSVRNALVASAALFAGLPSGGARAETAMVAGYWTAPGQGANCAALVHVLAPDGVVTILPFGLVSGEDEILRGRWSADGDRLTLSFPGGVQAVWMDVDADEIRLVFTQDGAAIELERCSAEPATRIGVGIGRLPPVPNQP